MIFTIGSARTAEDQQHSATTPVTAVMYASSVNCDIRFMFFAFRNSISECGLRILNTQSEIRNRPNQPLLNQPASWPHPSSSLLPGLESHELIQLLRPSRF